MSLASGTFSFLTLTIFLFFNIIFDINFFRKLNAGCYMSTTPPFQILPPPPPFPFSPLLVPLSCCCCCRCSTPSCCHCQPLRPQLLSLPLPLRPLFPAYISLWLFHSHFEIFFCIFIFIYFISSLHFPVIFHPILRFFLHFYILFTLLVFFPLLKLKKLWFYIIFWKCFNNKFPILK